MHGFSFSFFLQKKKGLSASSKFLEKAQEVMLLGFFFLKYYFKRILLKLH
jgi:hypothetical protein